MAKQALTAFPKKKDADNIDNTPRDIEGIGGKRLQSFIERIERLEEEKKELAADIKDIYAEAKAIGLEVKILRKIVALRKIDLEKRREEEALLDLYKSAIGME